MSGYVAKVSLPGVDVKIATPEQCALHSNYPPLKAKINQANPNIGLLDLIFTARVAQNVTHTVYTIPHGYGYTPLTLSNIIFENGTSTVVGLGYAGVGANLAIRAECTATNFRVTIFDNFNWTNANARLRVSFYIFAENGS